MKKIILASQSPRRKEILGMFVNDFEIITSDAEEVFDNNYDIYINLMSIARAKGLGVFKNNTDSIVISADTVVYMDDKILQKPKDKKEAKAFLDQMSGRWHSVITAFSILSDGNVSVSDYVETKIKFYNLSEKTKEYYIDSLEWVDKAGGYGIQGLGSVLVEEIRGDYYNVVGLPISRINQYLIEYFKIDLLEV